MNYRFTGYKRFLDPDGYPAIAPPWGTLNAINLNTGEYAWKFNLGEYPDLAAKGTDQHRQRKLRRPDRHRRRPPLHRRHQLRQEVPRLRQIHRPASLGNHAALRRQRHPDHIPGERPPIRSDRRRRRQRSEIKIRRSLRSVRVECRPSLMVGIGKCLSFRNKVLSFRPERRICCPLSSRLQKSITKFGLSFRPKGGICCWLRATRYLLWLQTLLLTRSAKPPSGPLPNWSSCEAFLLTTNRPLRSRE